MNHTSVLKIIAKNTFTLFNFVNIVLAAMVIFVGSYKNVLFILIALANTLISIINEVRATKIVEKMRLISEKLPTVMRDGQTIQLQPDQVEKGDVLVLTLGDQIQYDSTVISGEIEVNESFITGEQDNIAKNKGDQLISGSFIVSGTAEARVDKVGADNFVNSLEQDAKSIKTADSKLFKLMNNIVKYISYTLIPIGALLLWARFRTESDTTTAVTSTVAALINMIPEGLILLTSSVLALATIRLSRQKVLVQDLYSIETLARVDCICLDKTGTLTTGKMSVHDYTELQKSFLGTLTAILSHQTSINATTSALKQKFLKSAKFAASSHFSKSTQSATKSTHSASQPTIEIPRDLQDDNIIDVISFSSDRKFSGVVTKKYTYLMGAIEFITDNREDIAAVKSAAGDYRVVAVVRVRSSGHESTPELLGYVRLEDEIRHDAKEIINYFYKNNVAVKIISGDDLSTVTSIAEKVGIIHREGVDLSTLKSKNYNTLVKDYSIFTRVRPSEKKQLIKALKKQGYTVAMTGDGVNDILAMKEADVSLAIGEGSDAARRASKLVLLNSDFSAVPSIIDEGRQSINNLERSTSLFLAKTVYASILAVLFVFLPTSYPFSPIEMSLLNFACIGFPAFVLALEHNTDRIKNRFARNILVYSFPIGLTVSLCMLALSIIAHFNGFTRHELTTTSLFIVFVIDLILIYWISKPLNHFRRALLLVIIGILILVFAIPFARNFFEFVLLGQNNLIITVLIIAAGVVIFEILKLVMQRIATHIFDQ